MPSIFQSLPFKALLAVVVTAVLVGVGVVVSTPTSHAPADPLATRLGSVDTTAVTVRRAAFCTGLPDATVAAALGSPVASRTSWRPGQTVRLSDKVEDVADEYGCSWTSASGRLAKAWLFAPPVTADRAAQLAAAVPSGCTALPTTAATPSAAPTGSRSSSSASVSATVPSLAYGRPTSAMECGDSTLVRGLFGDAWLSCELSSNDLDLVGRWCLAVARAAG